MNFIDNYLDRITMYRLVLYYLIGLVGIGIVFCFLGYLPFNGFALAGSAGLLTIIAWLSNQVFAYVFEAPVNVESVYITALILALIVNPVKVPHDVIFLTAVAGLAIASKFILAIRKKHIFNPAAIAVALTAWGAGQSASWWIGSVYMLPFVLIGGVLITRKISRSQMVVSFFAAVLTSTIVVNALARHNILANLQKTTLHSSLFFLAFVMLTEPLTSPATKTKQTWYGILTGVLFPPQVHLFSLYSTPELSLLAANVFSYLVSPKYKLIPVLRQKVAIAPDTIDFVFNTERPISWLPGQYLELTLPHKNTDNRGNRRYFTLASSPTENDIRLGVKFYPNSSSFKKALYAMTDQTPVAAGQFGGDFILPKDPTKKLVFIAGGIGITPYRSMIKYLLDTNQQRDITLLYSEKNSRELAYTEIFKQAARQFGTKVIYTLTDSRVLPNGWTGQTGKVSADMITAAVPDYHDHLFYISGPPNMVNSIRRTLHQLNVPRHNIKTDFFPGYA